MPLYAFKVVAIEQCQIEAASKEEAVKKLGDGQIDKWNTGKRAFHGYKTTLREWKEGDDEPMPPHAKPTTSGNIAEYKAKVEAKRKKTNSQVQVTESIEPTEQADGQN